MDPFKQFDNMAQLLEDIQPMIDLINATKAKVIAETGCTPEEGASFGVALAVNAMMSNARIPAPPGLGH